MKVSPRKPANVTPFENESAWNSCWCGKSPVSILAWLGTLQELAARQLEKETSDRS
jgi:hypothetical protein